MDNAWVWEKIAHQDSLTEGPVWDGDGLLYSHCAASLTWRWDAASGKNTVWRSNTNETNGMQFDRSGRLFVCEGAGNRVVEVNTEAPDEAPAVVADNLDGARLNMPNDLAIASNGRIYFSDPNYSSNANNLPHESVYLAEHVFGGNWTLKRVTLDTKRPNGVLLSADQKTLFVAESPPAPSLRRELRAYPINDEGTLGDYGVLFNFGKGRGIDGMTLNTEGQIVATAGNEAAGPGPMIYVFEPTGLVRATHRAPQDGPTNCTFGGPNLDILFVTFATGYVYKIENTGMTGQLAYPARRY